MINRYRIFDKGNKEYCEEPDHRWMLTREGRLYNSENDEYYNIGERYLVEFSTGCFDGNNVEIFEGDKFDDLDGGYYTIEYNIELSKFCVNSYHYTQFHNEGGGEEYDTELKLCDINCLNVEDLSDDFIIGNINI